MFKNQLIHSLQNRIGCVNANLNACPIIDLTTFLLLENSGFSIIIINNYYKMFANI